MKRAHRTVATVTVTVLLGLVMGSAPARSSSCPSATVGGKTIGWIEFDDVRVPLKQINYPAGGVLDPPDSAKVAGVSKRHQPLLADEGTTVIAWHVRFGKGCEGSLNPILKKRMGSTFDIVKLNGDRKSYRLVEREKVPRGGYPPEWFRTNGSPQVALFTCSDLKNGKFRTTSALFAEPVSSA